MLAMESEESYLINKAKLAQSTDPSAALGWILAAKTLYPNNFAVQFEAYSLERNAKNFQEAAKCLGYIVQTFKNPPEPLWQEIAQLTAALRTPVDHPVTPGATQSPPCLLTASTPSSALSPPSGGAEPSNFYVQMFKHIPFDVQQQILQMTAGQSDNNLLEHSRLILLLIRRFPETVATHAPRLLETLVQGFAAAANATEAQPFREMLMAEALPLVQDAPPELPGPIVNRIMATAFEHHINQMFRATTDDNAVHDHWTRLFDTLNLCGRMLKWEPFPRYDRAAGKDQYWKAVCQIVSAAPPRPSENKQILFCATVLFVLALQAYMRDVRPEAPAAGDAAASRSRHEFVLIEGFRDASLPALPRRRAEDAATSAAQIVATSAPCSATTAVCLVTAASCWQLLHSNEILQIDFTQLLRTVPLSAWISRFLIDLAFYVGSSEEARAVLADSKIGPLEHNVRVLSLVAAQSNPNVPLLFECMLKTLADLKTAQHGELVSDLTGGLSATGGRHMVLLPLSRRGVLQYCTHILVRDLKLKLLADPASCSDSLLGNLLVLLQLDWPAEHVLAEQIFAVIVARGTFTYLPFTQYVICCDLIEQFMSMCYPHGGDIHLVLAGATSPTDSAAVRHGTRGANKGQRDDFKLLIREQIRRCNDPVDECVQRFIVEEQVNLMQNLYEKSNI